MRASFAGSRIADVSVDEIARLGFRDERKLAAWRELMRRAFPDVKSGDHITGVYRPGAGVEFFHQGRSTGVDQRPRVRARLLLHLARPRHPGAETARRVAGPAVTGGPLPRARLGAYAALALPLAMAALPVYVYVPKFYGDTLGLSLATVGAILLAARLLDALQDPLARLVERPHGCGIRVRAMPFLVAAVPLLAVGMIGLFHPPAIHGAGLSAWLAGCLVIVYLGFSMGAINYFAIGAELSDDYHERTRVTAVRGAFGVVGVLIAAALPEMLAPVANGDLGTARDLARRPAPVQPRVRADPAARRRPDAVRITARLDRPDGARFARRTD